MIINNMKTMFTIVLIMFGLLVLCFHRVQELKAQNIKLTQGIYTIQSEYSAFYNQFLPEKYKGIRPLPCKFGDTAVIEKGFGYCKVIDLEKEGFVINITR